MQKFEALLTAQVAQVATLDPVLKVGATTVAVAVEDVTPIGMVNFWANSQWSPWV